MGDLVRCAVCGTELERRGQGHSCLRAEPVAAEPPAGWALGGWIVVGFIGLYIVCAVLAAVLTAGLIGSGGRGPAIAVTAAWVAVLAGMVIAQRSWDSSTRRLADAYGFTGALTLRNWYTRVYGATAGVTLLLQSALGTGATGTAVLIAAARVAAVLVLLANVLFVRGRVLRLVADSARQSNSPAPIVPAEPAWTDKDLDDLWNRISPS